MVTLTRCIAAVLLCTEVGGAQSAPADRSSGATIAGKVISHIDGRPQVGATVRVRPLTPNFQAAPDPNASVASAVSGPGGEYSVEGLPEGSYHVFADFPGYVRSYSGCSGEEFVGPCAHVKVAAGQCVTGVNVRLMPEGSISGLVLDAEKKPLGRVRVTALRAFYDDGRRQWLPLGSAETNEDGEYALKPLAPGRYVVQAEPSAVPRIAGAKGQRTGVARTYRRTCYPDAESPQLGSSVTVAGGAEVSGIDPRMPAQELVKVAGKVKWAGVEVPKKALVLALQTAGFDLLASVSARMARVGEDGTFVFDEVEPGEYILEPARIRVDPAAFRHVSGAMRISVADRGLQNLEFAAISAPSIEGVLRILEDEGEEVAAAKAAANGAAHPTGAAPEPNPALGEAPKPPPPPGYLPEPIADQRGGQPPNPPPPPGGSNAQSTDQREAPSPLAVAAPRTPGRGGAIWLRLSALDRLPINPPKARTDAQRRFQFVNVPTSLYALEMQGIPDGTYVKEVRFNRVAVTNEGIDLRFGGGGELEIILSETAGRIAGVIQDAKGNPVGMAWVSLWRPDRNVPGGGRLAEAKASDNAGAFEFASLEPGRYVVMAGEGVEHGLARAPEYCRFLEREGTMVTLGRGERRQVRLRPLPAEKVREAEMSLQNRVSTP